MVIRSLLFLMLSVSLFVLSGCGDDSSSSTPQAPVINSSSGKALYEAKCQACHTAASLSFVTTPIIKQWDMTIGLDDSELNTLVAYLAPSLPNPDPGTSGQQLFATKCGGCHSATSLAHTTVATIKAYPRDMTFGLSDADLQKVADYLATL